MIKIIFLLFCCIIQTSHILAAPCKEVSKILSEVSAARHLKSTQNVPCIEKSKAEVLEYLNLTLARQLPPNKLRFEELILKTLELIPKNYNYKENLLTLYTQQIGGYYDPYTKSYSVANWLPDSMHNSIAIHELTHALQDQNFNLQKLMDPNLTTDEILARAALIEGDATFTMHNFVREKNKQPDLRTLSDLAPLISAFQSASSNSSIFRSTPKIIQATMLFPYSEGLNFIHSTERSRPNEIDRFFSNPPQFTSQIIHPENYDSYKRLKRTTCPIKDQMKLMYSDSFGEYIYKKIFDEKVSHPELANNWKGDVVCIYGDLKNVPMVIYLESVWDPGKTGNTVKSIFSKIPSASVQIQTNSQKENLERVAVTIPIDKGPLNHLGAPLPN